jgi:hypothetical protein
MCTERSPDVQPVSFTRLSAAAPSGATLGSVLIDHQRLLLWVDSVGLAAFELSSRQYEDRQPWSVLICCVGTGALHHLFMVWSIRTHKVDDFVDVAELAGLLVVYDAGVVGFNLGTVTHE